MRRRPGIGGLQTAAAARDQYRVLGENVAKIRTDLMKEQLATFRSQLEDFARKHKNDIRKNPAFRSQFHEMCTKVGVDPLASNKGFWAELLGIGDFYYELGVQIVDICLATRPHNGGLINLQELCNLLRRRRKSDREAVSEDDCLRAISKLKVLGSGFEVISVGRKKLVRSVPTELNKDHFIVGEMGEAENSSVLRRTLKSLCVSNGWSYGVFWCFDQRNPMLLSLEDAYFEDPVGAVIENMLLKVHVLGEGIIGQTALNGKYQWIQANGPSGEWNSFRSTENKHTFQDDSEVCYQFSSGIKTIVVVPVEPRGLVQFGSTEKIRSLL